MSFFNLPSFSALQAEIRIRIANPHQQGRIKKNPKIFVSSQINKNIRRGLIAPQTSIIYLILPDKNEIEIITFWDNRKNPTDFKIE